MAQEMPYKGVVQGKSLITDVARELFLSCMDLQVSLQRILRPKCLSTCQADMRPDTLVAALMALSASVVFESLVTITALEESGWCHVLPSLVLQHVLSCAECLPALITFERSFASMLWLVVYECLLRCERLRAFCALKWTFFCVLPFMQCVVILLHECLCAELTFESSIVHVYSSFMLAHQVVSYEFLGAELAFKNPWLL